jgi:hypothetical protein
MTPGEVALHSPTVALAAHPGQGHILDLVAEQM